MKNAELLKEFPENQYTNETDFNLRKRHGQIFTPIHIAQFMTNWITAKISTGKILDPAVGLGIFFRQLLASQSECCSYYHLVGYEVDSNLAKKAEQIFTSLNFHFNCEKADFLSSILTDKFDGIVCNPPYIHFQDYEQSLPLIHEFNEKYNLELNGFSNIYVLFLIKSLELLKSTGRAAFIIPSEFLNADYGTSIKEFLVKNRTLTHLIIFDPDIQVFAGFLTTTAILLFDGSKSEALQIHTVKNLSDLNKIQEYIHSGEVSDTQYKLYQPRIYSYDELKPAVKWKHFYGDLKINLLLEKQSNLVPFTKFANARRGIASGANEFFTLSQQEIDEYGLSQSYFTPCLTRAAQIRRPVFGEKDLEGLVADNKKVFLLKITDQEIDFNLRAYLAMGEERGYHLRYLTSNRQPWYSIEPLTPADLLIKTFGRQRAFFIQNNTQAIHLTCFHGIYLNSLGQQYRNIFFLYLLTDLAREIFEGQKRDYSAGLGKFEPNDIKKAMVLDLTLISPTDCDYLEDLYRQYVDSFSRTTNQGDRIKYEFEQIFDKYWRRK